MYNVKTANKSQHTMINFYLFIHLHNQNKDQNIKHFQHPRRFPQGPLQSSLSPSYKGNHYSDFYHCKLVLLISLQQTNNICLYNYYTIFIPLCLFFCWTLYLLAVIHVIVFSSISSFFIYCCFSLYERNTIQPTTDGYLNYFQFIAITHKNTINMLVHVLLGTMQSFLLGIYSEYDHWIIGQIHVYY